MQNDVTGCAFSYQIKFTISRSKTVIRILKEVTLRFYPKFLIMKLWVKFSSHKHFKVHKPLCVFLYCMFLKNTTNLSVVSILQKCWHSLKMADALARKQSIFPTPLPHCYSLVCRSSPKC